MEFVYGKQDFKTLERGEENGYLMTNGLGGFSALTMAGSGSRREQTLLTGCVPKEAPNSVCTKAGRAFALCGFRKSALSFQPAFF